MDDIEKNPKPGTAGGSPSGENSEAGTGTGYGKGNENERYGGNRGGRNRRGRGHDGNGGGRQTKDRNRDASGESRNSAGDAAPAERRGGQSSPARQQENEQAGRQKNDRRRPRHGGKNRGRPDDQKGGAQAPKDDVNAGSPEQKQQQSEGGRGRDRNRGRDRDRDRDRNRDWVQRRERDGGEKITDERTTSAPVGEPLFSDDSWLDGDTGFGILETPEDRDRRPAEPVPPDPTLDDVFDLPADVAERQRSVEPENGVEIVGVHFPQGGKVYYFAPPAGAKLSQGDKVLVETARGTELGEVALPNRKVAEEDIVQPLKPVIRKATPADLEHHADNIRREPEAEAICREKIAARGLDMKLVGAQYTFDNTKLIFYFTAAQRVDFRELVKDLASVFRTRIELRQIGIRDEAKMLGGKGVCGRKLCCSSFLPNYAQVTIKMAKEQGLALTSSKISGNCGRLMCCLKFEHPTYEDGLSKLPTPGSVVDTPDGRGTVCELRPIPLTMKVRLDSAPDEAPKRYPLDDIKVVRLAAPPEDDQPSKGRRVKDRTAPADEDIPED